MIRQIVLSILIKLLARELRETTPDQLGKEQYDGLMSQLWQNPAFRKYVADRDAKIIWALAGGEGFDAEPRETYIRHCGQRVENLILAREAKAAWTRMEERKKRVVD